MVLKTNIGIDIETNGVYLKYFDEVSGKIVVKTRNGDYSFFTANEANDFIKNLTGGTTITMDFSRGQ